VSAEQYSQQASRAIGFLRGRHGPILGELAKARDQAAAAMRFEAARRHHRSLEALATLAERASRLSRVVTENNLVIVLGESDHTSMVANGAGEPQDATGRYPVAYVILSGRLALVRELDSPPAAAEIAQFVVQHYESYKMRPVMRAELEPMAIVARWLKERTATDGRILPIDGTGFNPAWLTACSRQSA
jgi:excinuclease UvrABC nuclease subunit